MPTPPSTSNYQTGGVKIIVGGLDLGNVAGFGVDPSDLQVLEHFSARSGARKLDKKVVVQKALRFRATIDEHAVETYRFYFMGSTAPSKVYPLQFPLLELNCVIEFRNESAVIWTYSHTKVTVRPSAAMDFGEFSDWVGFEVEIEALEDTAASPATFGTITFT